MKKLFVFALLFFMSFSLNIKAGNIYVFGDEINMSTLTSTIEDSLDIYFSADRDTFYVGTIFGDILTDGDSLRISNGIIVQHDGTLPTWGHSPTGLAIEGISEFDGNAFFDAAVAIGLSMIIFDDKEYLFGSGADITTRYDTNGAGDDLLSRLVKKFSANDTGALWTARDLNPSGMTDHDNYLSPTPVWVNDENADTGDYIGVVQGWRTQADVEAQTYYDFYSMVGSSDGTPDGTTTEIGAIFRFGASGTATTDHGLDAGDVLFEGDVEIDGGLFTGDIILTGELILTPSADQTRANDSTITADSTYVRVVGDGGAVLLDTIPAIEDGSADGQIIFIQGTHDTNTVQIADNVNVQLAGGVAFTMGKGDILQLIWDAGDSDWYEVSRSDN